MLCKIFASQWYLVEAIIIATGPPDLTISSDASGTWGCGAWINKKWFQPLSTQENQIAVKELIPVLIATLVWGQEWECMDRQVGAVKL